MSAGQAPRETIGGKVYAFGTLPATKALPIGVEIGPIYMESMAEVAAMSVETLKQMVEAEAAAPDDIDEAQQRALLKANLVNMKVNAALLSRISAVDWVDRVGKPHLGLMSIMNAMFEHVTLIDGGKASKVSLDATFTGNLSAAKDVLMASIKVNFSDFFPASPTDSQSKLNPGA